MYLLPKEPSLMKPLAIAGLVLIGLEIAGLVLGQFSYTTEKTVIDVGPITASVDEKHVSMCLRWPASRPFLPVHC